MLKIIKNFTDWIKLKEKINNQENTQLLFKQGEVWMCYFGENVGFESNGKNNLFHRPVLILHKFNKNLFYGIPLSTKVKDNKFYITINFKNQQQSAIISQLRVFDAKRLHYRKGKLHKQEFELIKIKFLSIFQ